MEKNIVKEKIVQMNSFVADGVGDMEEFFLFFGFSA